jgi:hypothetical protein
MYFFPVNSSSEIRVISFKHQWYYRYRLHLARSRGSITALHAFLASLFESCPNHIFEESGFRCSKCKVALNTPLNHAADHEIIALARESIGYTNFKSAHENLQKFFLDRDSATLAAEVPLWLEPREVPGYGKIFNSAESLTGHIDLLRYSAESGNIAVWDYKPHARRERFAATQVFLYAYMLSFRSGIPLAQFSCGYFDEEDAYTFDPAGVKMPVLNRYDLTI